MEVFPGISMDPKIRFGKPCIAGTRIDVATVLGGLASGASIEDLESEYQLSREQVSAALRYAAHVAAHLPPAVASSDENPSRWNFPLALVRELQQQGREVEHIILLGLRGIPDAAIIDRLNSGNLLFLTHDQEFLNLPHIGSPVIVSRVTQSLPIAVRVGIWLRTISDYFSRERSERLFEVFDDGKLRPWMEVSNPKDG